MKKIINATILMVLTVGLFMSAGCSSNKGGGYEFRLTGNATPQAKEDIKWRHKYMIEQSHGCMNGKAPGLKEPKGTFVLHFSQPVGRSNGRPELRRENGWLIYGEAWKDGGTYNVALPNNGDGYPDQAVHLHEAGHLTEFANNFANFHDPRFKDCFRGTFWIQRSARSIANLMPGPDKPLLKPQPDLPEMQWRLIKKEDPTTGNEVDVLQGGIPIPDMVPPVEPIPPQVSVPNGKPWTPTADDFINVANGGPFPKEALDNRLID